MQFKCGAFTTRIHKKAALLNGKSSSGKKVEVVLDFLTYSRETRFLFSYGQVGNLHRPNVASNEINRVSKFDKSLSFGAKQNSVRQIFFAL